MHQPHWRRSLIELTSLTGLILLVADIWAMLHVVQSAESSGNKLAWIVLILLVPLLGLVIWWLTGPRRAGA